MSKIKVLIVEDDPALAEALKDTLELTGYVVDGASTIDEGILAWSSKGPDIVVSDINLGERNGRELLDYIRARDNAVPFIFMTAYGTIDIAVSAIQKGANEFLQKPFKPQSLIDILERYRPASSEDNGPIINDANSQALYRLAEKIATTESTVLLNGPSGAGKEVMSRFIHEHSHRADKPFIALNCAAIPENMLEATLFGYEKGAFTGAHQAMPGKFEQAQGGTLLLDEISEMDLALQAKLLRVLQEKEVERLGGRKTIQLDVRVIATTNRNLTEEVTEKRFREDLYYRLNVFPLTCLALKDRPEDIIPLAESILAKYATHNRLTIPSLATDARSKLMTYEWPGNVRELDNVMQRALILSGGEKITSEHLMFESTPSLKVDPVLEQSTDSTLGAGVRHHEYQIILDTLKQFNGKKKQVADELGISPRTLRYKLAKMRELGYDTRV